MRRATINGTVAILCLAALCVSLWGISGRLSPDICAFVGAWLLEWFPGLWLFSVLFIHSPTSSMEDIVAERERYRRYLEPPKRFLPAVQGLWIGFAANHPLLVSVCHILSLLIGWFVYSTLFRRRIAETGDPPPEYTLTRFTFLLGMELSGVVAMLIVKRLLHLPVRAF